MKDMKNMKKNEIFEARVEGYSSEAMGVCRLDGRAVFLPRALSGEDWELKLVKVGAGCRVCPGPASYHALSPGGRSRTAPILASAAAVTHGICPMRKNCASSWSGSIPHWNT